MDRLLFVGLGNPGQEYEFTRHNLGSRVLGEWAQRDTDPRVTCLFPSTPMNQSGEAVARFIRTHRIPAEAVVLIHDDVELPFGEIRWKSGGGAAGHNGVRSVHQSLGTPAFARLRLGVGRPLEEMTLREFVLSRFSAEEEQKLSAVIASACGALATFVSERLGQG